MALFDEKNKVTIDDDIQELMNKLDAAFAEKFAELERLERGEEPVEEQKEDLSEEQINEMVLKAIHLSGDGKRQEAMELFHFCAEAGNAEAQYWLGMLYSTGAYNGKDENLAFEWYKKAADQGYKMAFVYLAGWYHENGKTLEDRRKEYQCYWNYRDIIMYEEAQRAFEMLKSGVVPYNAHEEIVWRIRLIRTGEDIYDVGLPSIAAVQVIEIHMEAVSPEDKNYVKLETGDYMSVPAFVKQDDFVVIDPMWCKYIGQVDEIGIDKLEEEFEKAKQREELEMFQTELEQVGEQFAFYDKVCRELLEQGESQKLLELLEEPVQKGEIAVLVGYIAALLEENRIGEAFKYFQQFGEWIDSIREKWDTLSKLEEDEEMRAFFDTFVDGMIKEKASMETGFETMLNELMDECWGAYDMECYTEAYETVYPLAESGVAKAQNMLGVLYYYGRGVKEDNDLAYEWYSKAAEQGYLPAYKNLGDLYFECGANIEIRLKSYECYKKFLSDQKSMYNSAGIQAILRIWEMIENEMISVSLREKQKYKKIHGIAEKLKLYREVLKK